MSSSLWSGCTRNTNSSRVTGPARRVQCPLVPRIIVGRDFGRAPVDFVPVRRSSFAYSLRSFFTCRDGKVKHSTSPGFAGSESVGGRATCRSNSHDDH